MDKRALIDLRNKIEKSLAMPITRCTYKEIQSAMTVAAQGDQNTFIKLLETLLTGKVVLNLDAESEAMIEEILERYGTALVAAKEVHDKGDFINLLTSDLVQQQQAFFFTNIIRRIDGKYLDFICDLDSLIHIIEHFSSRLEEVQRHDQEGKILLASGDKIDALIEKLQRIRQNIK